MMANSQSAQKWDALLALPGEGKGQGQLQESHPNPDVFEKEAEQKTRRTQGQDSLVQECKTKSKSSEELAFYKGLDQIFSGDPATFQAKRLATEPKTSSPLSSPSSSTSDLLDSCQELYSSDLEEDLEGEDSLMSSFWPLGEETQDIDLAFPANIIDPVRLGQTNGSSSSPPVARADEVNACATINPKAVMTPAERLALIKRRRGKDTAAAAIEKIIRHSSSQMTTLLSHLDAQWDKVLEWDRELMQKELDSRKELAKAIAEEGEAFRNTLDRLHTSMDAQTEIFKNMFTLMASHMQQGNGGGVLKRKRLN